MNVPASGRLLRQLGHPNFRHTGRTIECSNPRCVHPRSKAMKSAPLCLAQTEPRVHDVPAARGTGQKPRRLRRSASAREDLRTAIETSTCLAVAALDLTLDRRTLPRVVIAARDVLIRIEVAARDVIVVEPYIVFHIALGAPVNSSTKATHPRVDRRCPVFAYVGNDCRLASAKNEPRLAGRLIASICANQIRSNA